jgi:hypothetical protein
MHPPLTRLSQRFPEAVIGKVVLSFEATSARSRSIPRTIPKTIAITNAPATQPKRRRLDSANSESASSITLSRHFTKRRAIDALERFKSSRSQKR